MTKQVSLWFFGPVSAVKIPSDDKTVNLDVVASVTGGDGSEFFAFGFEIPTMPGRSGRQLDPSMVRAEETASGRVVFAKLRGIPAPLEGTYAVELMLFGHVMKTYGRALFDVQFVA
jgi:hypothetical protein